ncbi:MAG TPA: shikimate kinase [Candidatus Eisenbacteria bacterium]|jgi:shikimate kinase
MSARLERPIALIGIMGCGKSTVARLLAARSLGPAVDLDETIEAEAGCSIAELFAGEGEATFRRREGQALRAALGTGPRVLACGGGIVLDPSQRSLLTERCHTVWLEVSVAEAWRRLQGSATVRPLLIAGGELRLRELLAERSPLYAEVARIRVATDGRSAEEVATAVAKTLEERCD